MKDVFCVDQLSFVKPVASNLPVGARLQNCWKTWEHLGAGPKVVQILKEGYTLPFWIRPNLIRSPTVISCYVIFYPHRNLYLLEVLHQLINKNAVELVKLQNGDTRNHRDLPLKRGVSHLRMLIFITYTGTVQEISEISCPGPVIPVQSPAIWTVNSTLGVCWNCKRDETGGFTQGYKDPPVPRRLVGESQIPPYLSPTYPDNLSPDSSQSFFK